MNFKNIKLILSCICLVLLNSACASIKSSTPGSTSQAILRDVVALNTTNPPGNERSIVEYLGKIFDHEKIEYKIYPNTDPSRANIVATVRGNQRKKPILLVAHMDVVPVERQHWESDPFKLIARDGRLYGRGVADMKGILVAQVQALLNANRQSQKLDRDIIFAGVADEEVGSKEGIQSLLQQEPKLTEAEYAFTEGGGGRFFFDKGNVLFAGLQVAEKSILNLKVIASGKSGHAMYGINNNAILNLAKAIAGLDRFQPNDGKNQTYSEFKSGVSKTIGSKFENQILKENKELASFVSAMSRSTIAPTILKAGTADNVIPNEASVLLNCRLLPNTDKEEFIARLRSYLPKEGIVISRVADSEPESKYTAVSGIVLKAYASAISKTMKLDLPVLPSIGAGATDSRYMRAAGINSFGIYPFPDASPSNVHGNNESLSIDAFEKGVEIYKNFVLSLSLN